MPAAKSSQPFHPILRSLRRAPPSYWQDGQVPSSPNQSAFSFALTNRLEDTCTPAGEQHAANGGGFQGRTGTITTPHGEIQTPAFIAVGTKATVKAVLPEAMQDLGAQALLANAYHLYLQPGADIIDDAGGLGRFMNWSGPTFTDSGGFQVMSLGSGFKKVINMDAAETTGEEGTDDRVAAGKERLAHIDDDGVWFKSHLNGDRHRFTPEVSMQVQHQLGADIMFAFDELTTLLNSRGYQEMSLERTRLWAERCIAEHFRLTDERVGKPYQALFGVIQGAQYEDLRRKASRDLGGMNFDGFGIGGALEKENLGTIVRWCTEELPEDKPRHLLGISEPDDIFTAIENGADTFDCVSPTRVARTSAFYTPQGRLNLSNARFKRDFGPLVDGCDCYACAHYSRAYIHHLFRAKEMVSATLVSIHNERFVVKMVDDARLALDAGTFFEFKEETLGQYYQASPLPSGFR
ncbi:MAG: queuine tRNA-ribosyltransferase [Micrococcaceae bacterium]|nr:queuine tRNA-ribosyltransferase [Micrococcaceae bacterium]